MVEIQEPFANLAKGLNEKVLTRISEEVITGYKTDLQSRGAWETAHASWSKLFALQREPKTFPWKDSSNVKLPMLTTACVQFQARALPELLPAESIVKSIPIGQEQEDMAIAQRTEMYANYQLMYKMPEFEQSMDTTLLKLPIDGTVIRKTYYDATKGRVVSDFLSATDFVINYSTRRLEDSKRHTQHLYETENAIRIKGENGQYINTEDLEEGTIKEDEVKQQGSKNTGQEATQDSITPRLVLEQYVEADLSEEGDKIKLPYIITVDLESGNVFKIVSSINPITGEKMEFFTAYHFIPNPDGFYGYGFGLLLEGANEAINSIMNQLIDSGTLQNLQSGFVLRRSGMQRGDISLSMGKFTEVDLNTDDVRKAIQPLNFSPPSQVLFALLGTLQTYADRLTTVTEAQTGELPKSDTGSNAVAILVEQGMKVFNAIHKRSHISFKKELSKLYALNSIYLDIEEYVNIVINKDTLVNPETGKQVPIEDVMEGIKDDFSKQQDVRPISDPSIVSRQERITKAQSAYEMTVSSPLTAENPNAIYAAQVNVYRALEIPVATINSLIQPPPPPPPPPDLPQEEENAIIMNGGFVEALEHQNHVQHLKIMDDFDETQFYEEMEPNSKSNHQRHKLQHMSFLYLKKAGERIQQDKLLIEEAEKGEVS